MIATDLAHAERQALAFLGRAGLAGQLAVLRPEDAHAPKLAAGGPSPVHKIVVEVAVDPEP